MHMLDSGCDHYRNSVWIWSFQEWISQSQRHRSLLWFLRRRKAVLGLCTTAIVLVQYCSVLF